MLLLLSLYICLAAVCLFIYFYLRECALRIVVDDIICLRDGTEGAITPFLLVLCSPVNPISPTCQTQMISELSSSLPIFLRSTRFQKLRKHPITHATKVGNCGIFISQMSGYVRVCLIFQTYVKPNFWHAVPTLSHVCLNLFMELLADAVTPFSKSQTDCACNEVSFFFPSICFSFSSVHSIVHYSTNEAINGSGGSLVPRRGPWRVWEEAVS